MLSVEDKMLDLIDLGVEKLGLAQNFEAWFVDLCEYSPIVDFDDMPDYESEFIEEYLSNHSNRTIKEIWEEKFGDV